MKTPPGFVALLVFVFALPLAHAGELRVGAAAVNITPPNGIPMAGYYATRLAEGTHDDLHAKAIVLDGGRVAISNGCPPVEARLTVSRRGTTLRAQWPSCRGNDRG